MMKKLLFIAFILCFSHVFSQGWFPVGNGLPGNGVDVLFAYDSVLYSGGAIDTTLVGQGVTQWNGSKWSRVGKGVNGVIYTIIRYNGYIYMGGDFDSAGGMPARGIALWDGHSWSTIGKGIDGAVYSFAIFNGDLYVGGFFDSAGGKPIKNIAKWNGSTWDSVGKGTGQGDYVDAMQAYNGKLYVGGFFDSVAGVRAEGLATWDGTQWDSVTGWNSANLTPPNLYGSISAFLPYDSILYIGGLLQSLNWVCQWNDTAFKIPSYGTNYPVNALIEKNGLVYVGGQFDSAGHISANEIAVWNGSSWSTLGSGLSTNPNDAVYSLAFYNGALYAAGVFNKAGGYSNVNNIAVWGDSVLGVNNIMSSAAMVKVYPNPSNGEFTIAISHPELVSGSQTIQVYNILGEQVYNATLKPVQGDNNINITAQPNGVYLYRVTTESGDLIGEGKIIIQK